jgi:hypothetical protein
VAPTNAPLLLRVLRPGEANAAALRLILRACSDPADVRTWCDAGQLYVLVDLADRYDDEPLAAALLTTVVVGRIVELRTVATRDEDANLTLSLRIVEGVLDEARSAGVSRAVAAASRADSRRGALLRGAGFRCSHVGRNGAAHDVVWFGLDL